jgi:hypothetical protein
MELEIYSMLDLNPFNPLRAVGAEQRIRAIELRNRCDVLATIPEQDWDSAVDVGGLSQQVLLTMELPPRHWDGASKYVGLGDWVRLAFGGNRQRVHVNSFAGWLIVYCQKKKKRNYT